MSVGNDGSGSVALGIASMTEDANSGNNVRAAVLGHGGADSLGQY